MRSELQQTIPGNPGSSFIVALMFIIRNRFNLPVPNALQDEIFTKGIVRSPAVFFTGALHEFSRIFKVSLHVISDNKVLLQRGIASCTSNQISFAYSRLDERKIETLLDQYGFIVLSIDLSVVHMGYSDYHFVCLYKQNQTTYLFDPKYSKTMIIDDDSLEDMVFSIKRSLNDARICFLIKQEGKYFTTQGQ